jgi:hypothetical protein
MRSPFTLIILSASPGLSDGVDHEGADVSLFQCLPELLLLPVPSEERF